MHFHRVLAGLPSHTGLLPFLPGRVRASSDCQAAGSGDRYLYPYVELF